MNKKNIKKLFIILTLVFLIITIYKIVETYSLFQSESDATVELPIAKWNIELNETDITNGLSEEIIINDFSVVEDANVKEGKIAPGMYGMVDLTLDPIDTDVSVKYEITLGDIGDQPIRLQSVQLVSGNSTLIRTDEDKYTGIMNLQNIKNNTATVTIRITVLWENDENNNETDTLIGTELGHTLDIPISVDVIQYLGEEIVPYVGD